MKCKLCGKEHRDDSYGASYRTLYLKRDKTLESGYYMPHLSEDEKRLLDNGENSICIRREACRQRRLSKLK